MTRRHPKSHLPTLPVKSIGTHEEWRPRRVTRLVGPRQRLSEDSQSWFIQHKILCLEKNQHNLFIIPVSLTKRVFCTHYKGLYKSMKLL